MKRTLKRAPGSQRSSALESYPGGIAFFRNEEISADTEFVTHAHDWGQIICVKSGVIALDMGGQRILAPSGFAVWIPAGMEHSSYNHTHTRFRSINIHLRFCQRLPLTGRVLNLSPLCNQIIDTCFEREIETIKNRTEWRLCRVLIDELAAAPAEYSYLPGSEDKYLAPILRALEASPGDKRSLAQWAKQVYTTERTLARRCSQELGMSFSEWRQRLRFLYGVSLLDQGKTVQQVALEVGYSSASAFITMFQNISGTTPERYRRR
ncbi:AraC family transcriptional regulator [Leminorella grimontii]|uniref:AraC family transcriptional regulator n=1 Tax=Leminorella grimontii TaxID=82981 RepID=UPI002088D82B|nr:helix-turn-helix transcriptional regulator [Leminorella grimontii]GKX60970.1 AraC family transcriptional regulator [Leminorella grimontii]